MTIKDTIGAVERFHNAFKIENSYTPTTNISEADIELRHRLMREENDEYLEAAKRGEIHLDILHPPEVFLQHLDHRKHDYSCPFGNH